MNDAAERCAAPRLNDEEREKLARLMALAWASRGARYKRAMARVITNLEADGYRFLPPQSAVAAAD